MKKLLAILAVTSLLFVSCGKDEYDFGQFDYDKELLFGTWEPTHIDDFSWMLEKTSATFSSNGTYTGVGYFGYGVGVYKLSGNFITAYVGGVELVRYEVISLSNTNCVVKISGDSNAPRIKCKKVVSSN